MLRFVLMLVVFFPLFRQPGIMTVQALLPVGLISVLRVLDILFARRTPVALSEASMGPRNLIVLIEIGLPHTTKKLIGRRVVMV